MRPLVYEKSTISAQRTGSESGRSSVTADGSVPDQYDNRSLDELSDHRNPDDDHTSATPYTGN